MSTDRTLYAFNGRGGELDFILNRYCKLLDQEAGRTGTTKTDEMRAMD
jgi:hypothetical protein